MTPMKRIDKLIALNCNLSRKEARQLIKNRDVSVNGKTVLRAEELVNTEQDEVNVKGYDFTLRDHIYIMMNKPEGVISATTDSAKKTVIDLVPEHLRRRSLFPCGRLDRDTTGLLIITDDGAYAHKFMSPAHHVNKTYVATLARELGSAEIELLERGIVLEDGTECLPAKVKTFTEDGNFLAEITIGEGKYHQVKRMFAAAGNHVEKLRRISAGALRLDESLAPGECREMTEEEKESVFE